MYVAGIGGTLGCCSCCGLWLVLHLHGLCNLSLKDYCWFLAGRGNLCTRDLCQGCGHRLKHYWSWCPSRAMSLTCWLSYHSTASLSTLSVWNCTSLTVWLPGADWNVNRKQTAGPAGELRRERWVGKQMFWPQNCCMALISSPLIAITGFSSTCCSKRNVPGRDEKKGDRDRRESQTGQWMGENSQY